jgi:hypothetical protein
MAQPLNSTKAAALIELETGRACTRQNLEKLCERGGLRGSRCILQAKPLRVDGDLVVSEYLANVAPFQVEAQQPRAKREREPPRCPSPPTESADELPEYTISRARSEFEKANLLELDRKAKERELLRREDVQQAWSQAVNLTRTKLLGVPSTVKQRIPHLEVEEIEVITGLIREALDELAGGEVAA